MLLDNATVAAAATYIAKRAGLHDHLRQFCLAVEADFDDETWGESREYMWDVPWILSRQVEIAPRAQVYVGFWTNAGAQTIRGVHLSVGLYCQDPTVTERALRQGMDNDESKKDVRAVGRSNV